MALSTKGKAPQTEQNEELNKSWADVMEHEQATEISSSLEETTDTTNNNTSENSTNIHTEDLMENPVDKGDNQSPDHQVHNHNNEATQPEYKESLRENKKTLPTSISLLSTKANNEKRSNAEKDTTDGKIVSSPPPNLAEASTNRITTAHNSTTELLDKKQPTPVNMATASDSLAELDLLEEPVDKKKTLTSMLEEELQNNSMSIDADIHDSLEGFTPVIRKKKKKIKTSLEDSNRPSSYQKPITKNIKLI
ncbi:13727_t:CDS:2 [Racocetra fulgida]|uniref:13727_t:CDS:1 n=1 Tax=Racocetra fulgida TaxID=60492 RepID=A0A9N9B1N6_9GLOM|nr:13727_t:CDS:2 [Racocetra fulgida]